jgi:hypothetical protein
MTKAMTGDVVADRNAACHHSQQILLRKVVATASKAELRRVYGAFMKTMVLNYDTAVNPPVMSPDYLSC